MGSSKDENHSCELDIEKMSDDTEILDGQDVSSFISDICDESTFGGMALN